MKTEALVSRCFCAYNIQHRPRCVPLVLLPIVLPAALSVVCTVCRTVAEFVETSLVSAFIYSSRHAFRCASSCACSFDGDDAPQLVTLTHWWYHQARNKTFSNSVHTKKAQDVHAGTNQAKREGMHMDCIECAVDLDSAYLTAKAG